MLGIAKGMEYLHSLHPAVVHGDLRSVCHVVIEKDTTSIIMYTAEYPD